jgi:hypothetical protein
MNPLLIGPLLEIGKSIISKVWPDPAQQAEANARLIQLQQSGELEGLKLQLSAILAEAQSADPWTARARPTFLYVMYLVILLCVAGGILGVWWPEHVERAANGINQLLGGLPEQLWWLFGTGYLGYTGARTWEKRKGSAKWANTAT